jgi:hypothetical protein
VEEPAGEAGWRGALLRVDEGASDIREERCARFVIEPAAVCPHRREQLTERDSLCQGLDGVETIAAQGDIEEVGDQGVLKVPNCCDPLEELGRVRYPLRRGGGQHRESDQPRAMRRCGKTAGEAADIRGAVERANNRIRADKESVC